MSGGTCFKDNPLTPREAIGGFVGTPVLAIRLQHREKKRFSANALLACGGPGSREKVTLEQEIQKGRGTQTSPQVAVIGGSASGFFTASLLARAGCAVELLERSDQFDPTPRTLIVTNHMRSILGRVGDRSVVNEIRKFELFTDGRSAQVPLNKPDLIIERSRLIRDLAEDAQGHGAKVSFGNRFVGLQSNGNGLRVGVERTPEAHLEELHADVVVGADGALSRVAQSAGWPRQATVPLVQAIVRVPADMSPNTVRVWFVPDDTPYFYWLIPESNERAVLGLIGEDGQETRHCLERFMEKRGFTPLGYQGARIPVYERWTPVERRVGAGRVFLVGDAAGQVKVSTVGGIVTGFRGAIGVSESIVNGGESRELRSLRRELDLHLLIRKTIHQFKQADYSRLVDLMNDSTRRSLSQYTRDEASRVLWNIALSQPRLLLLALRGLLSGGSILPKNRS
ncbi:MAG TPA: NAD(P)/FAD-dependent oxidoreductase [Candidatus Sulfotelmatobacter sp.]|nr:NAD(P)/FAD-dependent oxidoreductase [Candidatus Sulfotelmatobacter sp.]